MKLIKVMVLGLAIVAIGTVLTAYFIWLGYPKTKLNIYILDKTVKDMTFAQHRSFVWMLNNDRFVTRQDDNYSVSESYFGFIPLDPISDRQYKLRKIKLEDIDSMSTAYDVAYYTDANGVYFNEWFRGFRPGKEKSVIDGGLNQNDYLFLKALKEKGKLLIAEFNTLHAPTSELICYKTAELFGLQPTGWYGKYFSSLDSDNIDIPYDIIETYASNTNMPWNYKGEGIIVTNGVTVIVLEEKVHLIHTIPILNTGNKSLTNKLPDQIAYTNWFEMVTAADSTDVLAQYQLNLTEKGDSLLKENGLKATFPAIIAYNKKAAHTCYFAGDFSNSPVTTIYSRLANSRKLVRWLTHDDQKVFFYDYYYPLLENVLKQYAKSTKK